MNKIDIAKIMPWLESAEEPEPARFVRPENQIDRSAKTEFMRSLVNILIVGLSLICCGCTPFDALNATVPAFGYSRTRDQCYGDLSRQKLDVYRPNGVKVPAPVVVFFYGGNWQTGSKNDYRFVAQALSSKGFVTVMPDYRLYPEVQFPAFVQDAAMAVRWVKNHIRQFGGDPDRIHLAGHSAGAHIAVLLTLDRKYLNDVGLDCSAIRATAGLSGPYDFVPSDSDLQVFGMASSEQEPDPNIEPITFTDGLSPPVLLVTGLADRTVDPSNTAKLAEKLGRNGGKVETITYPRKGHVDVVLSFAWAFRWLTPALRDTAAYFQRVDRDTNVINASGIYGARE